MGNEWEPPRWQREGRTGPNGPRYANRADRRAVQSGHPERVGKQKNKGCPLTLLALLSLPAGLVLGFALWLYGG